MRLSLPFGDDRVDWRKLLPAVALAAIAGGLAYLLALGWPAIFSRPTFSATASADCDPRNGPCVATFDQRRSVRLTILDQPPAPLQTLRMMVDSAGIDAGAAMLELSGVDMNMGLFRYPLDAGGGGSFAADLALPVCIRRRMRWRALVEVDSADGIYQASFEFAVNR